MTIRAFLFVTTLVAPGAGTLAAEPPRRPNVLILFADDQRADTIAAWGNTHIRTPNLDKLVARGTSFRNNYCFGSNSGAVCVPSRAMLMTGKTWFDVKHTLDGATLLPEVLRQNGYETFATGKWHNGEASFVRAFPDARSVFFGGMADHTRVPICDVTSGKVGDKHAAAKFSSEEFADQVIRFIKGHTGEKPFFCYVAFTQPHDPRNPPEKYRQIYYQNRPPLPGNFRPLPAFDNGITKGVRDEDLAPFPRTKEVISDQLCEYYGHITYLDEQVGRILDALEKAGRDKDTLIIYAADHGLALGSHGLIGKQNVYEDSMKCPLIVAGPGVKAGQSTKAFSYLLDLFPSICDAADIKPLAGFAGYSLRPIWSGEKEKVRDSVFLPFLGLMRAVRDERWKLIVYPPINHRELFDLMTDREETKNVADDPANTETIERLTRLLNEWQEKVGDKQSLTVPKPKPKEISFDGYVRKVDQWQPEWVRKKYFEER